MLSYYDVENPTSSATQCPPVNRLMPTYLETWTVDSTIVKLQPSTSGWNQTRTSTLWEIILTMEQQFWGVDGVARFTEILFERNGRKLGSWDFRILWCGPKELTMGQIKDFLTSTHFNAFPKKIIPVLSKKCSNRWNFFCLCFLNTHLKFQARHFSNIGGLTKHFCRPQV